MISDLNITHLQAFLTMSRMAHFSADRACLTYAEEIWNVESVSQYYVALFDDPYDLADKRTSFVSKAPVPADEV